MCHCSVLAKEWVPTGSGGASHKSGRALLRIKPTNSWTNAAIIVAPRCRATMTLTNIRNVQKSISWRFHSLNPAKRIFAEWMRVVVVAVCVVAFAVSIAEQTVPDTHDGGADSHLLVSEHSQAPNDTPDSPTDHAVHIDHCAHGHAVVCTSTDVKVGYTQIANVFPLVPGMPIELSLSPETPPPIA